MSILELLHRIRTITITALLCALAAPTPAQKSEERQGPVSFLVASEERQPAQGRNVLSDLVDRAAALPVKPLFLILLGSVTDTGSPAEYEALRAGMKHAADAGITVYAVPGPRDVSLQAEGKDAFQRCFGHTYHSFDTNSAHFIILDTTVALRDKGHLEKSELDWLDKDLRRTKPDAPLFLFMYNSAGQQSPSARMLDNDYALLTRLKGRNVVAMFTGEESKDAASVTNGITMFTQRSARDGSLYRVTLSQLIANFDRLEMDPAIKPVHIYTFPTGPRPKGSQMKVVWDDPDLPWLERRRPAATLAPRAVADNPDKERAEYRVDSGQWKPLTKDRRDIWSDVFLTKPLSIGIHSADVRLTTSNDALDVDELIFEVERDSKEATRKWAIDLPGSIQSSPVLAGDTLVVSCQDGKLYGINPQNGKKRWTFPAKAPFIASPVVADGVIYIGSTDKTFYAVELSTGRQKWKFDTESPILSTAACAHGVACFGTPGGILGIDIQTGLRRWLHPAAGPFDGSPATDGKSFYLNGKDGVCYSVDAATGNEHWHVTPGSGSTDSSASSPCVLDGRVYIIGNDAELHCLDAANGDAIWSKHAPAGGDSFSTCSPTVCGHSIIVCGDGRLGSVYAYEPASSTLQWRAELGQELDSVGIRPAPDGRSFALMGVRGRTAVMDVASGTKLWGYELGPGNIFSTPAFDGSVLYTTTIADDVQAINAPGIVGK